jgi:hypothetical protein
MVQDGTGGKSWQVAWDDDGARDHGSKFHGARCRIKMEPNVAVCGSLVGFALGFPRELRRCTDGLPHWMLPNLPCMHAAGSRKLHFSPMWFGDDLSTYWCLMFLPVLDELELSW